MREILFRGKSKYNENWIYGCICFRQCEMIITHGNSESWDNVYESTIGQYTGLKDKNGKMIFEGDIVAASYGGEYIIVWGADGNAEGYTVQGWGCRHIDGYMGTVTLRTKQNEALEVIDNIHDNPELLENVK